MTAGDRAEMNSTSCGSRRSFGGGVLVTTGWRFVETGDVVAVVVALVIDVVAGMLTTERP